MLYVVIVDFSAAMYVRAMSARHPRRRAAVAPEAGVQPLGWPPASRHVHPLYIPVNPLARRLTCNLQSRDDY